MPTSFATTPAPGCCEARAMTKREREIFDEMLAALRSVVIWHAAPPHQDAPAITKVKAAVARAECWLRE
jgi:hypothetical protein